MRRALFLPIFFVALIAAARTRNSANDEAFIRPADNLKNGGTTTWFLMPNDEGHGYSKKKNQDFQFYATVMFVKKCFLNEQNATVTNRTGRKPGL